MLLIVNNKREKKMMDYKLYSIPLCDINRPIYYMMKSFLVHKIGSMPADNLEEEWSHLKVEASVGYRISFPTVDLSQPYDSETMEREVIIFREREKHVDHYYIDVDPATCQYRLVEETDRFSYIPTRFYLYNVKQMMQAIDNLLPLLKEAQLKEGEWLERLQTTRAMLKGRVNELHILHNGGLYDYHVLGQLLSKSNLCGERWYKPFSDYVSQLKVFAMYAVNLDWNSQGSLKCLDNDMEVPSYINDIWEKERLRRKNMNLMGMSHIETIYGGWNSPQLRQPDLIVTDDPVAFQESEKMEKLMDEYFPKHTSAEAYPKKEIREEKYKKYHKMVLWYVAGVFGLVGLIMLAKYWLTGTVAISVGVITSTILHNIQRLKANYIGKDEQPNWFVFSLIFFTLVATSIATLLSRIISESVYTMSDGKISPWVFFAFVAFCMVGVSVCAWLLRKGKNGVKYRIYTFLMIIPFGFLVGQCAGSMGHANKLESEDEENLEVEPFFDDVQSYEVMQKLLFIEASGNKGN